jgi:nucleotide-binding universal stress UspA family protein
MFKRILAPLDGSPLAESVFPYLVKICESSAETQVILFSVCEPPRISSDYVENAPGDWEQHVKSLTDYSNAQCSLYVKDAEKKLKDMGLKNLKIETRLGDPANEIVDYASKNNIDVIVMASHGRSGPSRWAFGSVADKVFRSTCVPVLMVRGPGCTIGV